MEGGGGPRGRGGASLWPTDPGVFLPVLVLTEGPAVPSQAAPAAGLSGQAAAIPAGLQRDIGV